MGKHSDNLDANAAANRTHTNYDVSSSDDSDVNSDIESRLISDTDGDSDDPGDVLNGGKGDKNENVIENIQKMIRRSSEIIRLDMVKSRESLAGENLNKTRTMEKVKAQKALKDRLTHRRSKLTADSVLKPSQMIS